MGDSLSKNTTISGVHIPDDVYVYSNRKNYISYFYINNNGFLYVFDKDVVKLQSLCKSKLKVYINKEFSVYTKIAKDKILLRGLMFNTALVETAWGYEQYYENM
ncbi:hypothetical protein BJD16_19365 [Aeromonas sobria]|uniref:Uncharacterized protein n=1 Tax=Aeromonas sobria TaxID=646 RepID=A0A1S2CNN8_AERSO|nr:hypothetical protein BJD16_19365 [Aeromonas sobria]